MVTHEVVEKRSCYREWLETLVTLEVVCLCKSWADWFTLLTCVRMKTSRRAVFLQYTTKGTMESWTHASPVCTATVLCPTMVIALIINILYFLYRCTSFCRFGHPRAHVRMSNICYRCGMVQVTRCLKIWISDSPLDMKQSVCI